MKTTGILAAALLLSTTAFAQASPATTSSAQTPGSTPATAPSSTAQQATDGNNQGATTMSSDSSKLGRPDKLNARKGRKTKGKMPDGRGKLKTKM